MSTKRKFTVKAATDLTDDQAQMLHKLSEFAAEVIADIESDYGKKLSQNGWGAVMDYTENIVKHPEDVERLVGKGLDSMKLHLEAVICDIYEDDTGIQGIYESTSIRSGTKVRKFTIKAASSDKFYTREFPSVEAGKVKVAPQRGNWTVFIGLSDGTIAYQWCESKEKALREAKYARDVVKKYGSDAPYWTAEGYKIWNPKADASTSAKRRFTVTASAKTDLVKKLTSLYNDYNAIEDDRALKKTGMTLAEYNALPSVFEKLQKNGHANTIMTGLANYFKKFGFNVSLDGTDYEITASTATKRKFSVKASATAKRKAAIKASDLSDKSEYHLYGYDKDGADVDTRYTRSANDIADAVDELFGYDEVDTVDIYRGGKSDEGDYVGTVTRAEYDNDAAARVRELLDADGIKGAKSVECSAYRSYEDPYKLEKMLEDAKRELSENPENPNLYEYVAELEERLNFAWQDDEYDAEYADRFDEDVFGKSAVKCADKSDTIVVFYDGNFVSSGGWNAVRDGIHHIVSRDDAALKACIDYCNSFGDSLIGDDFASPRDVADTMADVIEAEYNESPDTETFFILIPVRGTRGIEIFDKALAAVGASTKVSCAGDEEIEKAWDEFADVPMNPETEEIEEDFMDFPAGTNREEIWHWFDKNHSKGVESLLYGEVDAAKSVKCAEDFTEMFSRPLIKPSADIQEIFVTFVDGRSATYTSEIIDDLRNDPDVDNIIDNETGELLYLKNEDNSYGFRAAEEITCSDNSDLTVDISNLELGEPYYEHREDDPENPDKWVLVIGKNPTERKNYKLWYYVEDPDTDITTLELTNPDHIDLDEMSTMEDYDDIQLATDVKCASTVLRDKGITGTDDVEELVLYITNDYGIYKSRIVPIVENLKRKVKSGKFDETKAPDAFKYAVEDGVRKYDKEFVSGRGDVKMLSTATRKEIAKELFEHYKDWIFEDVKASTETDDLVIL
jgi:hypothetical protein